MAKKRRTFTREFKLEAVRLVLEEGMTVAQVARDLGIGETALARWRDQVEELKGEAFPGKGNRLVQDAEVDQLRRRVKQLERERDFLKKAAAYFANDPD
jgi:transposase